MTVDKLSMLNNIATTLATITVAGGYHTTVDTVSRQIKTWSEVRTTEMPWLGFAETECTYEHQPGNQIKARSKVKIVGHVSATTPESATTAIVNFEDDVIGVMFVDPSRGSDASGVNAMSTYVVRSANDVGDGAAMPDSRGGYGSFEIDFEITHMRTTSVTP